MDFYSITYDLISRKDYPRLYKAIMAVCDNRYTRPTESQWIVQSDKTAGQIRDFLRKHVDSDDVLFVIQVDRYSWSSLNMNKTAVNWLKS